MRPKKWSYDTMFCGTGEVLELADRRDLESRAERREGSSPSFPILLKH